MTLAAQQPIESPTPYRFTREEYYQLGELGFFAGRRVELIEGEIIAMAPQKSRHFLSIGLATQSLEHVFGEKYWVRAQGPLHLPDASEPEPDIAVVPGTKRSYDDHPTTALLVVEVSDTTLRFDRGRKAAVYARAGIQDYWLVNLAANCVEVMREPIEDALTPSGWRYTALTTHKVGETISPLAKPEAKIAVADLLP